MCVVAFAVQSAQAQVVPPQQGLGILRGVIYDSLARRPLPDARVWTADGLRTTVTGSDGRFRLDSVATDGAPLTVLAAHPAADSVGLPTLATLVRLIPGGTAYVTIAIPSYRTLRAAACAGIADAGEKDGGILFGTVQDAVTREPVSGAVTGISWIAFLGARGRREAGVLVKSVDAVVDGSGTYYACGLPTGSTLAVRTGALRTGSVDSLVSGEISVTIGARRILRQDLLVADRGRATILVRVLAKDGRPLEGAKVFADGAETVVADGQGQATLRDAETGTRHVGARLIGFAPAGVSVELAVGDTALVVLRLEPVPQQLEAVRIQAARLREEVEHRRRLGVGHTISGERLARSPHLRAVFWQVPSVQVSGRGIFDMRVVTRGPAGGGWCAMQVYIDGRKSIMEELQLFEPSDLEAVEVYPRGALAPGQYVSGADMGRCGVILAWTKRG